MYRSPKEQYVTLPEQQLLGSSVAEAAAFVPPAWEDGEWTSSYSSASEQFKRTPRKPSR
ncbi:hypothetical protein O9H85_19810 [Paenibacillus filicis]|uniref:Uncharacterized protein n=1 Tax=Paenibacillus gyeongsangnamensis TaxID=3388067 RepID=A0ABT4QCL5_9BACL|nr:hypothetical protein [Paenibacillus filicis]MCZ8514628.1 hypothetical protein [Paenibacillus filicis]